MSKPVFEPAAAGLSLANAEIAAAAAELVYESDRRHIRSTMRGFGFRRVFLIAERGTELFLARSDTAILVAFRGTESNLTDWGTNAQFRRVGGPLGMVHEGFAESLGLVWHETLQKIQDYQDQGQGVWFCGHSLGGALATLATAKFLEQDWPVRGLYTFGSPRVGDATFEQAFELKHGRATYRFVNNNDLVTRVPTRSLGYRHVGDVLYFDDDGELTPGPSGWQQFLSRLSGRVKSVFGERGLDGIKDHGIRKYVDLIAAARQREENDDGE
ncbi:MAG: lipase family protein [bacterium]|nr:lipase family protein [bacterium]